MGDPAFLYRRNKAGEIESEIFDSDDMPGEDSGWFDSPAKAAETRASPASSGKKRRSLPKEELSEFSQNSLGIGIDSDRMNGTPTVKFTSDADE